MSEEQISKSPPTQWCTSSNEESFSGSYGSREEALREEIYGAGRQTGEVFYLGQAAARKASDYFSIDQLLEDMGEQASEDVGEAAEVWPDLSKEEIQELDKQISALLDEKVPVSFFAVENVEKITVTPELIAKYGAEGGTKG